MSCFEIFEICFTFHFYGAGVDHLHFQMISFFPLFENGILYNWNEILEMYVRLIGMCSHESLVVACEVLVSNR